MNRVINPKTKKYIRIDGPTYNKLLEEGYKKSYLNSLKCVENLQLEKNKQISYNDDVILLLIRYLQLSELFAFYHVCTQFNKLINNAIFIEELNDNYHTNGKNS